MSLDAFERGAMGAMISHIDGHFEKMLPGGMGNV